MDLNQMLSVVIPDPDECRQAAAELRLANPNLTPEQTAADAVRHARKFAVSIGATTGAFASPFTMFPAAVIDALAMLRLEGKLAGTIAALLAPDSLADPESFRRDILRSLFPGAVSQALRRAGVRAGERAAQSAISKLTSKQITERAAKSLGLRLAEKAVASKLVPIVGAGIGAAWNYAEVQSVGKRSIDHHLHRDPLERRVTQRALNYAKSLPQKLRRHPTPPPEGARDCR